jgi:hypothetical protein
MTTLTEKIAASKMCRRKAKACVQGKSRKFYDRLFDREWEVFVIKRDAATGKLIGRTACCALSPV